MDVKLQREHKMRIAEQAAEWLDTLPEASEPERDAFIDWILESRTHLEQFLLMSAVWREGRKIDTGAFDIEGVLAQAQSNVVGLREEALRTPSGVRPKGERSASFILRRKVALGAVAGLAAVAISLFLWISRQPMTLATDVGEVRTVALADGSTLHLSAHSKVQVRFSKEAREIELEAGEATFAVSPDAARPFRVYAGHAVVQALGTAFDVHRRGSSTTVSVIEGAVRVATLTATAATPVATRLSAGEAARVGIDGQIVRRTVTSPPAEHAPRHRARLSFDEDTLEDIAADFNRFNRSPKLRIEGEELARHRFTGTFNADDPLSLIAFLQGYAAVEVLKGDGEVVIQER